MSDKVELVSYQESLSIKVGKFLLSKGFDLASCAGLVQYGLVQSNSLGVILKDSEARPRTFPLSAPPGKPWRVFLGTVWFSDSARGANEQNWVFEVHGRKHVESLQLLAKEMASTFGVRIILRLVREEPNV